MARGAATQHCAVKSGCVEVHDSVVVQDVVVEHAEQQHDVALYAAVGTGLGCKWWCICEMEEA